MFLAQLLLVTSTSSLSHLYVHPCYLCALKRDNRHLQSRTWWGLKIAEHGKHEQAWKAWRTCLSLLSTVMWLWFQRCCLTSSLTRCESFSHSDTGGDKGSFCSFSACLHLPAIDKTTSVFWRLLALIWRSDSVKSRAKWDGQGSRRPHLLMQYFKWAFLLTWCDIHSIWVLCCSNINAICLMLICSNKINYVISRSISSPCHLLCFWQFLSIK